MTPKTLVLAFTTILLSLTLSAQEEGGPALHPRAPKVPDKITFAGETIRFDRYDMYERMDKELTAFTYMHTNSTLMLKRSRRYFSIVEPILRENGLPDDLKYLMAIESNLDPKAYSRAGAAGLWQFMKATAQQYGLEVNSEVDERYHPEKETRAACKFLSEAYRKFGNWMTVAAGYNAGQNGIAARVAAQGQGNALNLYLPEETSRYMFRLLVAKMFFEDPESFGFEVGPDDLYPPLKAKKTITVNTAVNWVDLAKENGTSYYLLREANTWIRDEKLTNKSGKTYKVVIPEEKLR